MSFTLGYSFMPCTERRRLPCSRNEVPRNSCISTVCTISARVFSSRVQAAMSHSSPWDNSLDSFVVDVVEAEASKLDVPLLAPFTIATMKLDTVQNVAICVTLRDGSVGWGEAPTLPPVTAEDQPLALSKAAQACTFLTAHRSLTLRELLKQISGVLPGHDLASVRAGMEMAVVDAVAHSLKLPLWKFFGGLGSTVTTDITIPICPPEEAEELAVKYAARGFSTIKTKVGGRALSADVELLRAIRRGYPTCSLILDANCGYTAEEALQVLKELHDMGLTPCLFEQPVLRDDWVGLGHVSRKARDLYDVPVAEGDVSQSNFKLKPSDMGLTPCLFEQPVLRDDWVGLGHVSRKARDLYDVPVAADESCRSLSDAKIIMEQGLAEVINVKLAKMGVLEALELVSLVRKGGLQLMIGGMVETRLAMGFAGHLAAGLGCFRFVDLDTPLLLAQDPVLGGYEVDGPVYKFSEAYGHGGRLK